MIVRSIKSFGRTKGRPLTRRQSELVSNNLQSLRLDYSDTIFDPRDISPEFKEIWLEIGFGGAEHLIGQAIQNPDKLIIGAEPFLDGVAKAVCEINTHDLKNIRIIDGDVRPVLDKFTNNCLNRVFLLFPDPWPKARHHKRRIISENFVESIARVLMPGGQFRFASDWQNYAEEGSARFFQSTSFKLIPPIDNNHENIPTDHITTRYQTKLLGDCTPLFFDFSRV